MSTPEKMDAVYDARTLGKVVFRFHVYTVYYGSFSVFSRIEKFDSIRVCKFFICFCHFF